MRTVKKKDSPQDYFRHFQDLIATKKSALVWQLDKNSNKRSIYRVILLSCRDEENLLKVENLEKSRDFELPEDVVYFFVEKSHLIFKSPKLQVEGDTLTGSLPHELKVLSDEESARLYSAFRELDPHRQEEDYDYGLKGVKSAPEFEFGDSPEKGYEFEVGEAAEKENPYMELEARTDKINTKLAGKKNQSARDKAIFEEELSFISLDEEDKLYADKRGAPRARPPEGKMVTMQVADGSRDGGAYTLFDLSQGGLSVLSFSESDYKSGELVHIQAFDTRVLDEPMLAEVKSVRSADDQGIQFKIGMQFVD